MALLFISIDYAVLWLSALRSVLLRQSQAPVCTTLPMFHR